jgi:WD40 repeat protein
LEGHSHSVNSAAFSPDGKYCLTGSGDKIAKLWDFETRKCLKTFRLSEYGAVDWDFPYAAVKKENICTIYKFDCFNPYGNNEPELIGNFYNVDGMHIKSCSFRSVTADETARKILYQYGGITTPDNEDRS